MFPLNFERNQDEKIKGKRVKCFVLCLPKSTFDGPPKGGEPPKKCNFKVFRVMCWDYSKLVSRDAYHNAKGINQANPIPLS